MNANQTFEQTQDQPVIRELSLDEIAQIGGGIDYDEFPVIPR